MISPNSQITIINPCPECQCSGFIDAGYNVDVNGNRQNHRRECPTCVVSVRGNQHGGGPKPNPGYLPPVKTTLAGLIPLLTTAVIAELDQREQSQLDSVNAAGATV